VQRPGASPGARLTAARGRVPALPSLPLRSSLPGALWPPLPEAGGATVLAMLWQLERTERLPRPRRAALQLVQARALIRHAARHSPAWAEAWKGLGFDPASEALTPGRFARLPVVDRRWLEAAGAAAFCDAVPPEHGEVGESRTAGTTGAPLRCRGTRLSQFMWRAITLRDHLWHRRDFAGRLAALRPLPVREVREDNWGAATAGLCDTGPAAGLTLEEDVEAQARWLGRENPDLLVTQPGNLRALAGWFLAHGGAPARLSCLRTSGEPLSPEVRRLAQRAFGLPVEDAYSARETGYLALQCPRHEYLHVQEEGVILELLGEDNGPVPPGAPGRVVVTVLHNYAAPLVRYDTGDWAIAGPPACDCGRTLATLARVLGRGRNRLRLRDGRLHWPEFDPWRLPEVNGLLDWQVRQRDIGRFELLLVVDDRFDPVHQELFARALMADLGERCDVTCARVDRIDRGPGARCEPFIGLPDA
jgi:phenylacetate-CoA ligase